MGINKDNIEIYILDYFEGNLSPSKIEELFTFLDLSPQWKTVFDEFELITIDQEDINLAQPFKATLKRKDSLAGDINSENIDHYFIRDLENDLSDRERIQLKEVIRDNPKYQRSERIYSYTLLKPDFQIVFPLKNRLKKQTKKIFLSYFVRYASVAAMLIITTVFINRYYQNDMPLQHENASVVPQENEANDVNKRFADAVTLDEGKPADIDNITQSHRNNYLSLARTTSFVEANDQKESLAYIENLERHPAKAMTSDSKNGISIKPTSGNTYYTNKTRQVKREKSLLVFKSAVLNHKLHEENENQNTDHSMILTETSLAGGMELSYYIPTVKREEESADISNIVIERINNKIGLEVFEKNNNNNKKINWRNFVYATARLLKDKIKNQNIMQRNDRENSEMIAIKLGDVEIGRSFAK